MYDLSRLPHHPPGWEEWRDRADYYPIYSRIIESANPKSFMEFGALTGYLLITALSSAPNLDRLAWVDNESYVPGSNALALANISAYFAKQPPRESYLTISYATRPWASTGSFDMVHVDGEHTYQGKMRDLSLALSMKPKLVLVDDYWHHPHEVGDAVRDFTTEHSLPFVVIRTFRGLAVFGDTNLIPSTVEIVSP